MTNRVNLCRPHPSEGRVTQFGCPWHGFKRGQQLYDAPGGNLIRTFAAWPTYAALDGGGSTNLLKVPGLAAVSRTVEEQALDAQTGHDWRNYALIAGRTLHGQDLINRAIYIDGNGHPWAIAIVSEYVVTPTVGWRVTATLESLFGRIAHQPYPMINRQLATLFDSTLELRLGYAVTRVESGPWVLEQNSTGSVVMVHVPIIGEGGLEIEATAAAVSVKMEVAGVFKLEVSGNGSMDRSTLGDGITATLSLYKGKDDCFSSAQAPGNTGESLSEINPEYLYQPVVTDSTDPQCPDCGDLIVTLGHEPLTPTSTPYTNQVTHLYRLFRVCFDQNDNEVIYSGDAYGDTLADNWSVSISTDWEQVDTYATFPNGSNPCTCTPIYPGSTVITGATLVVITWDYLDEGVSILLRNGVEVSRATSGRRRSMRDAYHTQTGREYAHELSSVVTIDSVEIAAGLESDYLQSMIHAYSPQLMGPKTRSTGIVPGENQWAKLYTVATPWGSDSAHDGLWIVNDDATPVRWLFGTQDPVNEIAYWYEGGVSDQGDCQVNFV